MNKARRNRKSENKKWWMSLADRYYACGRAAEAKGNKKLAFGYYEMGWEAVGKAGGR